VYAAVDPAVVAGRVIRAVTAAVIAGCVVGARMGAPVYVYRVIKFERIIDDDEILYELAVVDGGSREARDWRNQAIRDGRSDTTGGPNGREYGYW
jgi:hypothetical protein